MKYSNFEETLKFFRTLYEVFIEKKLYPFLSILQVSVCSPSAAVSRAGMPPMAVMVNAIYEKIIKGMHMLTNMTLHAPWNSCRCVPKDCDQRLAVSRRMDGVLFFWKETSYKTMKFLQSNFKVSLKLLWSCFRETS